jgi:hypothetical protein
MPSQKKETENSLRACYRYSAATPDTYAVPEKRKEKTPYELVGTPATQSQPKLATQTIHYNKHHAYVGCLRQPFHSAGNQALLNATAGAQLL